MVKWMSLVTLVVGGTVGFLVAGAMRDDDRQARVVDRSPPAAATVSPGPAVDPDELEKLRLDLSLALDREKALKARLAQLKESTTPPADTPIAPRDRGELITVPRADAVAEELMERGDIEGLWLLAADLLNQGEAGYAKFEELLTWFIAHVESNKAFRDMMRHEELILGRFMRAYAENDAAVLHYGLHLIDRDPADLPEPLRHLQGEFADEMGSFLLGAYNGDDPAIHSGYLEYFRRLTDQGQKIDDELVFAISQIPTEGSTDLLIELLESNRGPARDIVNALAFQKNPRALRALESFRKTTEGDERLSNAVDQAIRALSP